MWFHPPRYMEASLPQPDAYETLPEVFIENQEGLSPSPQKLAALEVLKTPSVDKEPSI